VFNTIDFHAPQSCLSPYVLFLHFTIVNRRKNVPDLFFTPFTFLLVRVPDSRQLLTIKFWNVRTVRDERGRYVLRFVCITFYVRSKTQCRLWSDEAKLL